VLWLPGTLPWLCPLRAAWVARVCYGLAHCGLLCSSAALGAKADTSAIAVALRAIFARLGARVWVEYVESASNPADGLSRAGLEDAWTKAQGWTLKEVPCPNLFQMETASVDSIQSIVDAALP
jgi:hypothetical protein